MIKISITLRNLLDLKQGQSYNEVNSKIQYKRTELLKFLINLIKTKTINNETDLYFYVDKLHLIIT